MTLGQKMPPSRQLAGQLGIARNTVAAVYDELVARGYLESVPRRGFFVARDLQPEVANLPEAATTPPGWQASPDWEARLKQRPSRLRHIIKPSNWQDFPYPFVYGQVDPGLFPINTWRTCSRDALGRSAIDWWTADRAVEDDPMLVEQIRSQILPQRGIYAKTDDILVTPDARNILDAEGADIVDLPIDAEGARLDGAGKLDVAVLTPAHHCPTMVTMSTDRRMAILKQAQRDGTIVIEDDYEGETAAAGDATSLKSLDSSGHVAYLGTLSKVLAPGVRLGFMVAAPELVKEARWLRRLMHRSAPLNNQRTAAIFLAEGHYLTLQRNLREALTRRLAKVSEGCARHLPGFRFSDAHGGSSVWLECPPGLDARQLFRVAAAKGVLTESGDPFVPADQAGRFLRLGVSYIDERKIDAGLILLGQAASEIS